MIRRENQEFGKASGNDFARYQGASASRLTERIRVAETDHEDEGAWRHRRIDPRYSREWKFAQDG